MSESKNSKNKNIGFRERYFKNVLHLTSANIFLVFLLSFLVGVTLRLVWEITILIEIILWCWLLFLLIIYFFKYTNLKILIVIVLVTGCIVGIIRTDIVLKKSTGWVDMEYEGVGKIVKFPEPKDDYQRVYLEIIGLKNKGHNGDWKQSYKTKKERVIFFAPLNIDYEYGKKYQIKCQLKTPENKYQKFNYRRFLASKKVYQICSGAKVKGNIPNNLGELNSKDKNKHLVVVGHILEVVENIKIKIFKGIYRFNKVLEQRMNKLFSMPESAYLEGLLLGGDNRLPQTVAENFRKTGTTHTVAVSGYNITILANVFMWIGIGIGLWRRQAFWFILGGIVFFIIMIGAPSSAVRAGIMGVILLYATQMGRLANSVRIIILTAVIMVFLSPFILLYDAGFQLSFLATLGIVLIYGPLSEKFKIENDFLGIKSIILVTISAQLGVLGVLIYTFDSISIVSLLANIIILPALPIIMLGGALAVIISFFSGVLGAVFASLTWAMLHLEIISIEYLAKIPGAMIEFNGLNIWWCLGYYFLLSLVLVTVKIISRRDLNN